MGMDDARIEVSEPAGDGSVAMRLTGELDQARADQLRRALETAVGDRTAIVRIDARDLRLLDSTSLGLLLFFARKLHDRGGYLELRYATAGVRRTLEVALVGRSLRLVDDSTGQPSGLR
jgi:anti-anti-sigma factor